MPTQTFVNLSEDKRQSIMDAALKEFATHTYENASVNKIVENSGIAKGSFYQYFSDKKDVYLHLIEVAAQQKLRFLNEQEQQVSWDNFFHGLTTLMISGARFDLTNPLFSKLLANAFNGSLADESLVKMKQMSEQYLSQLVLQARDKKQVRDDIPVDLAVFYLNSLITEFAKYAAAQADLDYFALLYEPDNLEKLRNLDLEGMIGNLMKLVQDGLKARKGE